MWSLSCFKLGDILGSAKWAGVSGVGNLCCSMIGAVSVLILDVGI